MEPVASTQKQTSMNPNAGSGRSFDPVLKIVALEGFIDLSMLRALTILEPVEAGGTAGMTTGAATAGDDLTAGLVGLFGLRAIFFGLGAVFLGLMILSASSIVLAIVFVLVIFLAFLTCKKSYASAMHRSIDEALLALVDLVVLTIWY